MAALKKRSYTQIASFKQAVLGSSPMQIAMVVSVAVHVVLLSLHFEPELRKFRDHLPVLEVVLVNAKTQTKPDKADVHAQANLDRGGNTDENRRMKTAAPALKQLSAEFTVKPTAETKVNTQSAKKSSAETKEQKRVTELEQQVKELMTQIESPKKVEAKQKQEASAPQADDGTLDTPTKKMDIRDMTQMALEMDRLEAQIAKQQDDYQKRPKRKFIGARVKEYRYAVYVDSWRQKVERIGTLNFPEAARTQKIYGKLQMTVSIKADGSIENIEINRPSGHKVLDEAAKRIVELGAPYPSFSDDMRKETDILSITRTWTFTNQDSLASEE